MKYLTKGELLTMLGSSANKFTEFMMFPESFGLTGAQATGIKVGKQQLDWVNTIDIAQASVITMMNTVVALGIVPQSVVDTILSIEDRHTGDLYLVNIVAKDVITVENVYGAKQEGGVWSLEFDFKNNNTGVIHTFKELFDREPTAEDIDLYIDNKIASSELL